MKQKFRKDVKPARPRSRAVYCLEFTILTEREGKVKQESVQDSLGNIVDVKLQHSKESLILIKNFWNLALASVGWQCTGS